MKHLFFPLLATLLAGSLGFGQVPQLMSHQGYVADSTGTGITGTLPMTFRMFNDSTGGSAILTQPFPSVTLTKGTFNVSLDVSTLSFTSQYWLETEVNSQILAPRTRLTSAPYSLAPWATSGTNVYYNGGNVGIGTNSPLMKLDIVGSAKVSDTLFANNVSSNSPLRLQTAGTTRMYLDDASGNVGIGTTSPSELLTVNGNGRIAGNYAYFGDGTIAPHLIFDDVPGAKWEIFTANYQLNFLNDDGGSFTSKMVITKDGNVGIGTTTPSAKLDVAGNVKIADGTQGTGKVLTSDENGVATWQNASVGTVTSVATGSGLAGGPITSTGTVGIANGGVTSTHIADGTITDADVNVTGITTAGKVSGNAITSGTIGGTTAVNSSGNLTTSGRIGAGVSTPANKLDVEGGAVIGSTYSGTNTAPSNGLLVEGNVGIGTTNPTSNLTIQSTGTTGYAGQIALNAPNVLPSSGTVITQGKNTDVSGNRADWRFDYYGDSNPLNAQSFGFYDIQPFVFFTTERKVGIRTNSPSNALSVSGGADFSGNVGIGTAGPNSKLEVAGVVRADAFRGKNESGTMSFYDISFYVPPGAATGPQLILGGPGGVNFGTINTTPVSDRRLKEQVNPMKEEALDRVMSLKPVSYQFKHIAGYAYDQMNPGTQEGFLADELQEVIPSAVKGDKDAVTEDGKIQPQSVNPMPVIAVLTKALQEQQKQIDELKALVKSLVGSKSTGELK